MSSSPASIAIAALATILAGCGDNSTCAGLPASRVLPSDTTIAVGQRLTVRLEYGGYCVGESIADARYQPLATGWTTSDPAIVAVDSLTGVVTGMRPGDAHVTPTVSFGEVVSIHVHE